MSNGNQTLVNHAGALTSMSYDKENRLSLVLGIWNGCLVHLLGRHAEAVRVGIWDANDSDLGRAKLPRGEELMPTTYYISTHGMIWGEISDAGVTTSYGHDVLGSVTEIFSGGALLNTYRYKPYGATLAKTGTTADPNFLWNGANGYRGSGCQYASYYVRRRHYSTDLATWTSSDALWPRERSMAYAGCNPTTRSDITGLSYAPPCWLDQFTVTENGVKCSAHWVDSTHQLANIEIYKIMIFDVTTKCNPAPVGCIGLCSFTQLRYGCACSGYNPIVSSEGEFLCTGPNWVSDDPEPVVGYAQCGHQSGCVATFESIDVPGVAKRNIQLCPPKVSVSTTQVSASAIPYEFYVLFATYATCGGQDSMPYFWQLVARIDYGDNMDLICQFGNDAISNMSSCIKEGM
jgi:RHS repeat-associated protein